MAAEQTLVYFNTQTTGLKDPHIVELAANARKRGYAPFHRYILPRKEFKTETSKTKFKLSADRKTLLLSGKEVDACILKCALTAFVKWLEGIVNPVLVDHYVEYHTNALQSAFSYFPPLLQRYKKIVRRKSDTLPLFGKLFHQGKRLTRAALASEILGENSYTEYNAREHVRVLLEMTEKMGISKADILRNATPLSNPEICHSSPGNSDSEVIYQRQKKRKRKNPDQSRKEKKMKKEKKEVTSNESPVSE
ncbi:uncharacterized protein LOC117343978 [Pecten maximus]|uniref:uncharacterized protein LOC117343978 n=1 Tax=Pecten maximus TaxID=6579 RepID=UPI00145816D9|nr:uncharacterized protein LOC117343978 [Pecten maximus]XP_033762455.1 uncharacterized protein LOC117343978 [Pecten maximus]XP_033762456.1 uncharacterized protein LOC117343978 [Pecten maximus]